MDDDFRAQLAKGIIVAIAALGLLSWCPLLDDDNDDQRAPERRARAERSQATWNGKTAGDVRESGSPAAVARQRVAGAASVTDRFDKSVISAFEIRLLAKGAQCETLHVRALNLSDSMMQALAHGGGLYGTILPPGINRWAADAGFSRVGYTSEVDRSFLFSGSPRLTRDELLALPMCEPDEVTGSEGSAAELRYADEFERLSWENASPGVGLYDVGLERLGTIRSVDRPNGRIVVEYLSGTVEPKSLDAVAPYLYVRR